LLGTDVAVAPFYHPVRLAEDAAMLAVMSGNRLILGLAVGYRPQEFDLYGVPLENRGRRFSEALRLMRRLWTEDSVTFEGEFYRVENGRIEPRPEVPIPVWVGGWNRNALRRAAELGDAWLPGPTADLPKLLEAKAVYDQFLVRAGKDPNGVPRPLTRDVVIAETEARARELAERHLLVNYRDEYGKDWQHPLIGQAGVATDRLEEIGRDRFIVGTPEQAVRQMERFRETLGVDHLICRLYFPGMPHDHILTELRLIAREIMPAFRPSRVGGG
jgi:alkanesulfonate monooxygenase SsuD/methylene tetrahydromethanopterin reductase-like flavin-dependent oxidoreductase (luciferase family)